MAKNKKSKRVQRTPQELLQAEYEKSLARQELNAPPSIPMDVLVSQGAIARDDQPTAAAPVSGSNDAAAAVAPLLLTASQVCALLNVSRTTFYRMRQAGEIPGAVTLGGQLRYHREVLEQWLLQQVQPSP